MSTRWTRAARLILAAGALAVLACAPAATSLTDAEVSLRPEDPLQTTTPIPVVYPGKDPGENKALERAFYGAPPMIPHTVADNLVSADANDCLDCHGDADEETPGLPPTHRIKAQITVHERAMAKGGLTTTVSSFGKAEIVAGSRYDCMLCHAPQTDAKALVDNTFRAEQPPGAKQDALDYLNAVGPY